MTLLQNIPLHFKGELHNIRLINFSVDAEEVQPLLPKPLTPFLFNGKAVISMVDVLLRKMRLKGMPGFISFSYRHIAFRLLVNKPGSDKPYIHFLQSFTDKPLMALGGSLFTHYKLQTAKIKANNGSLKVESKGHFVEYHLNNKLPVEPDIELFQLVGSLDSALSVHGKNALRKVQILREKWPLRWTNCEHFETSFFRSAQFLGAFRVDEVIDYEWLPPQICHL